MRKNRLMVWEEKALLNGITGLIQWCFFVEKINFIFRFCLTKAELLALTPQDIDFDNKVIRITKSYQRLEGKDIITDPKTPKSKRNVSIPDFLCEELKNISVNCTDFYQLTVSFI